MLQAKIGDIDLRHRDSATDQNRKSPNLFLIGKVCIILYIGPVEVFLNEKNIDQYYYLA